MTTFDLIFKWFDNIFNKNLKKEYDNILAILNDVLNRKKKEEYKEDSIIENNNEQHCSKVFIEKEKD